MPPCPLRLPLLFPKNLATLRFSGALFVFGGTLIIRRAQPSLFPQEPYGKLGALAQKRGFACARNLFHAFLGRLLPAERREGKKTPLSALWAAQPEFSSPRHISGHAIIKMPRLHLSCESRRYAANWGRLPKGVAFGRAERFLVHMFLGGLCIFPCLPPRGKVSRSDGRGALAFLLCHPELVVAR